MATPEISIKLTRHLLGDDYLPATRYDRLMISHLLPWGLSPYELFFDGDIEDLKTLAGLHGWKVTILEE